MIIDEEVAVANWFDMNWLEARENWIWWCRLRLRLWLWLC